MSLLVWALTMSSLAVAGEDDEVRSAPRGYRNAVVLDSHEVIVFDLKSPRIPAGELDKVLASPKHVESLNRNHLADLGSVTMARPCRVGDVFLDPGVYRVGVTVDVERAITLVLTSAGVAHDVALATAPASGEVPMVALAVLPREDIDGFDLEVRLAGLRAIAPIDFNQRRLIVSLNNSASDLLQSSDAPCVTPEAARLALRLSRRANEMTGGENALILDTYALALFHNGSVGEAISTQRRALQLLEDDRADHRGAMMVRLRTYELAADGGSPPR